MYFTKFQYNTNCYWPSNPKKIIEFIGGSYLATRPDFAYKRFIENLLKKNYAVHAYRYIPQFDHQEISSNAWKDFKSAKKSFLRELIKNLRQ